MKLTLKFLGLFASITYVFASTDYKNFKKNDDEVTVTKCIDDKCEDIKEKESIVSPCENAYKTVCSLPYDKYSEKDIVTKKNAKEVCTPLNKDECQSLIKDGTRSLPECKDVKSEFTDYFDDLILKMNDKLKYSCLMDNENNLCPSSKSYLELKEDEREDKEKIMNILKQNCASKKCYELTMKYFDEKTVDKETLNYLKSDNCTAQFDKGFTYSDIANSASTIYFCSALFVFSVFYIFVLNSV